MRRIFLYTAIFFSACHAGSNENPVTEAASEITITHLKLSEPDNTPVDSAQYKSKAVFINFWATWCKPCVEEMPSIQRAMEIVKDENIEFLFATDETPEQVEKFRQRYNFPFHYVQTTNYQSYGIMVLPTTFIFNKEGKLVFSEMGYRKWDSKNNIDLLKSIINQK